MGNLTGGLLDPLEWQKPRWHHLLFYFCGFALGASLSYLLVLKDFTYDADDADNNYTLLLLAFFFGFPLAQCGIGYLGTLCFDLLLLNRIRGCDGMNVEGSFVTSNRRSRDHDTGKNYIDYNVITSYEIKIPLAPSSLDDGEEKYETRKYRQQESFVDKLPLWAANEDTSVIALRVLKSDVAYATVVENRHCFALWSSLFIIFGLLTLGFWECSLSGVFTSLPVSIWFFQQLIWGCVLMVCSYTSPRKYELEEEYVKRMIKIGCSMRPNPNELEEEYAKRMMKHGINGPLHLNPNELAEPNELEVAYVKGMIKINGPTFPIGTFA